jgi:hypothetical protein
MKKIFVISVCLLFIGSMLNNVHAQRSTKKKKATTQSKKIPVKKAAATTQPAGSGVGETTLPNNTVIITSEYTPSLGNAAKINFSAGTPVLDTIKMPLTYNLPAQSITFQYQPVSIKPAALDIDTTAPWINHQYVKLGFGNYSTPYGEAGFSFGDGKKSIVNLSGNLISSKGNLPFQKYTKANIQALGIFNSLKNEYTSKLYYSNNSLYRYGYSDTSVAFTKSDLQQNFNNVGFELGFKNKIPSNFGVTYHPQIKFDYFFREGGSSEFNFDGGLKLIKSLVKVFSLTVKPYAEITTLTNSAANSTINNNLFSINTALQLNTPNFKLNVGMTPAWDNSAFSLLPDLSAESKIGSSNLIFMLGWVGNINKNTFHSLSLINPYIQDPQQLSNTKTMEEYFGFKGSTGDHFAYNAKFSFIRWNNAALFSNDTLAENTQTFDVLYEPQMEGIKIHAEASYTLQEKLTLIGAFNYTQITNQQKYSKPYGWLPVEISGSLRYAIIKGLSVKSDLFLWDGTNYINPANMQTQKLPAVLDFNMGFEFSVLPKLNIWLQFNNLLNSNYQRWNQYKTLGINFLGGIVYSFQ